MNGMESFDEVDMVESFDEFDSGAEAALPFGLGKKVFAPGGLASATLHTPKGPAKLNLPSPVATLKQYRTLENALNANTQRVNLVQNELARVRRELAIRRSDPQSQNMMSMFLLMKLSKDFKGHTHESLDDPPTIDADSSGFSSLLPLLMLQPNLFGQSGASTPVSGTQDAMSPLMLMVMMEAFD
jgi:hypothetical protein